MFASGRQGTIGRSRGAGRLTSMARARRACSAHVHERLSRYSVIFCRFFAAEKWRRPQRGRTRSDQSRRRPDENPSIAIARLGLPGNGIRSKSRRPVIRPSLRRRAQEQLFLIILFCRGTEHFFLVLPLPGRHTTDRTLAQCRCECPSSSQICSRQIQFPKVSPEQGSETGEASTGRSS